MTSNRYSESTGLGMKSFIPASIAASTSSWKEFAVMAIMVIEMRQRAKVPAADQGMTRKSSNSAVNKIATEYFYFPNIMRHALPFYLL